MEPKWKSAAAGIINIVGGLAALGGTLVLMLLTLFSSGIGGFVVVDSGEAVGGVPFLLGMVLFGSLGFFGLVLGAVALWGGIECLRRGSFGWAVAGSIATFLVLFPIGFVPVILVLMAEYEFEGRAAAYGASESFAASC